MQNIYLILFFLMLSGCLSKGSSDGKANAPSSPPSLSKDQATEIIRTSKCESCDPEAGVRYFQTTPLADFDDVEISVVKATEFFATTDARTQSANWEHPQSFAVFLHVQKVFERVQRLCTPVEIPEGVRPLYKDLNLQTNMDLLEQIDDDMQDILSYARYVEPDLILKAIGEAQRYQRGQIDIQSFERAIVNLKNNHISLSDSYDESMIESASVIRAMKGFEKSLGAEKIPDFPRGQNFFSWIGGVEEIRHKVIDIETPLTEATIRFYEDQFVKTKLDGIEYAFSQTSMLLKLLYPRPNETLSDYEQTIENLKTNLTDQDQCFAVSCVEHLNTIQKELAKCLN